MIVRVEILKAALNDPDTRALLHAATGTQEVERILAEFAQKHGFKATEDPSARAESGDRAPS